MSLHSAISENKLKSNKMFSLTFLQWIVENSMYTGCPANAADVHPVIGLLWGLFVAALIVTALWQLAGLFDSAEAEDLAGLEQVREECREQKRVLQMQFDKILKVA